MVLTNTMLSQNLRHVVLLPQNYNSAFAGINKCKNLSFSNNIHFITNGQYFYSNSLIFDGYFNKISGGLLIKIKNSSAPDNVFNSQNIDIAYSYHLRLNRKYMISFALGTQFKSENFNNNVLIFPNMIDLWSYNIASSTEFIPSYKSKSINFNTGAVFWSKNFYLSTSVNNFLPINVQEPLINNVLFTLLFERKKIELNSNMDLSINSATFYTSKKIEAYNGLIFSILNFDIGALSKQNFSSNYFSHGAIFLLAIAINKLKMEYSYEFYYSGFYAPFSSNSEITLKYTLNCSEKHNNNTINCPTY
ncbi:MAG: type IX secretion system membrane protein PorP/SprF [Bacteroidales bacterium]|nr:type IX secretion system membrane protein PorP/SprF [Bacteroidales bacterium]